MKRKRYIWKENNGQQILGVILISKWNHAIKTVMSTCSTAQISKKFKLISKINDYW